MAERIIIGACLVILALLTLGCDAPKPSIPDDLQVGCCGGYLCVQSESAGETAIAPLSCEAVNGKGV